MKARNKQRVRTIIIVAVLVLCTFFVFNTWFNPNDLPAWAVIGVLIAIGAMFYVAPTKKGHE